MRKNGLKEMSVNTPLIEIKYKYLDKKYSVYVKCEWFSLTGSIKDKVAYGLIKSAYRQGKLKKGDRLVEVSSGNMGISLVAMARYLGHSVTILIPKFVSEERKKLLRLYGAEVIETDDYGEAFKLLEVYKSLGYYNVDQFENKSNIRVHENITAREILCKVGCKGVENFVCGIGTSGTLIGVGRVLKGKMGVRVIALEPDRARIITASPPYEKHTLQGLSDEILPKIYDSTIVDDVIQITDDDAIAMSRKLCRDLSLGVGISSGANFLGAVLSGGNAITVFPDDNKKYLSTALMEEKNTPLVDSIELLSFRVV